MKCICYSYILQPFNSWTLKDFINIELYELGQYQPTIGSIKNYLVKINQNINRESFVSFDKRYHRLIFKKIVKKQTQMETQHYLNEVG